jgi:hypothetical protein
MSEADHIGYWLAAEIMQAWTRASLDGSDDRETDPAAGSSFNATACSLVGGGSSG